MTSIEKKPTPEPNNKPDVPEQADKPALTITVPQLNAEAQELVRAVDSMRNQLHQHPHYYRNEQLQTLGKELVALHYDVAAFLRSTSPIPVEFTERVHQQLSQAVAMHGEVECARFLEELEHAKTMQVRKNLEQFVQTHREPIEKPNLLTPNNATTVRAQTDMISRDYRKYGNSTMLGKIVREVGDKDGWVFTSDYMPDEALREEALVKDATRAVDLRLTEMGALLRQQPDRVALDVHAAREAYHGEVRRFAEALAGAGDVRHPALYQPELAAKYGHEAMAGYPDSILGLEHALHWVRALDANISGHFKSDGQRAAIDGLMSGIRHGLQEKMDQVGCDVAGQPEWEHRYHAIALDMARLFRTVHTAANAANLLSADTIRFHDKLHNGGDMNFARSMVEISMAFDDLAYEHHLAHGGADPLDKEIRVFLPTWETAMDSRPSLVAIRHHPQVEQMLARLRTQPVSLRESSARYGEFCSLRALMSSLEHPGSAQQPDAAAVQREIRHKMIPIVGSFRTYLATQSEAIENGTLLIGGTPLDVEKQESMKLWADMEGLGALNISDATAGYVRTGGKMAASIAVGVGVGMTTGGLGIVASSIAAGASMTAYNSVAEGRSFDSWEEATDTVGTEFILNAAGAGLGRVLAGARYAAQLKNVDTVGMGAREIFVKSMQRGGMKLFSEHYDECVTLGAKLAAAGAEGTLDALGSAALDTAFQGGAFWDNVRMNAMFCGISIGMEIGSDARRMMQWAIDVRSGTLKQLDGKIRQNSADIESLYRLCQSQHLDPQAVYRADAFGLETMLQSLDTQSAEKIQRLQERIQRQAAEIDQLLRKDLLPHAAKAPQGATQDERISNAPLGVSDLYDLAKTGDAEVLKTYLKQHAIDDATRNTLADTLVHRSLHPSVHAALGQSHDMPGAIDEGNMAKNIPKLGNVYDAIKAEQMGMGKSEIDAHTQAMREAKLLLDAGLAGAPPPPPPPSKSKKPSTHSAVSQQTQPRQSPVASEAPNTRMANPNAQRSKMVDAIDALPQGGTRDPAQVAAIMQLLRSETGWRDFPVLLDAHSSFISNVEGGNIRLDSDWRQKSRWRQLQHPATGTIILIESDSSGRIARRVAIRKRPLDGVMSHAVARSPVDPHSSNGHTMNKSTPVAEAQSRNSAHVPQSQPRVPNAVRAVSSMEYAYNKATETTNAPASVQFTPELLAITHLVSGAATVANIHVGDGKQGRSYIDFGNTKARELLGNGPLRAHGSDLPSALTKMTRYDYLSPENKRTESVTLSDAGNDYRRLTYYYHSQNYRDPSGVNPGSALSIVVYLKHNDANTLFQYLQNHPDCVRPLFKMASDSLDAKNSTGSGRDAATAKLEKPAEYLWTHRVPPYVHDDNQGPQRMLFVERGERNNFNATCRTRTSSDSAWKAEELPSRYQ